MLTVLLHARPTGNSGIKLNISRSKIQKKRQVRDNSSCGKVKFSQASVILSTGGGLYTSQPDTNPLGRHPLRQTPPQADTPPPPGDDHCSGRYASFIVYILFLLEVYKSPVVQLYRQKAPLTVILIALVVQIGLSLH